VKRDIFNKMIKSQQRNHFDKHFAFNQSEKWKRSNAGCIQIVETARQGNVTAEGRT
jgi:hypothetical protein